MYLISVYFDDNANKILQNYIDKIASATGNHFMTGNKVPPHMTISSIEAKSVDVLIPAFESLAKKLTMGEIQFVSTGQLLPYVIYASPVLNEYLFELSKKVYDVYKDIPETTVSRFYRPFLWVPHVTLGKTLEQIQMQKAFEVVQTNFSPFVANVVEIGLAKVNPHKDVRKFLLKEY